MFNLFEKLKRENDLLTKENKEYWESSSIRFNNNCIGPDGNYYDEEEIYKSIQQSDKERLIRLG